MANPLWLTKWELRYIFSSNLQMLSITLQFLHLFYARRPSLYIIFMSFSLLYIFDVSMKPFGMMDILYIGAILALLLVIWAFATGCDKLNQRQ